MRAARLSPGLTRRWRALGGAVAILPSMKISHHHIAAGLTVVALGLLATVALASGESSQSSEGGAPAAQSAPEVRTEIIRQTVHRRAKRSSSGRGSGSSVRSSSSPSPSRGRSAPATTAVAPVATPDDHGGRGRGRGRGGDDDGHHEFEDHDDHDGHHGRGRGRGRGGEDD
jgi:hypothetical protein